MVMVDSHPFNMEIKHEEVCANKLFSDNFMNFSEILLLLRWHIKCILLQRLYYNILI